VEEWGIFTEKSKDVQINEKLLGIFIGAMVGILVVNGLKINQTIKYFL
jgi:hypothetical protein